MLSNNHDTQYYTVLSSLIAGRDMIAMIANTSESSENTASMQIMHGQGSSLQCSIFLSPLVSLMKQLASINAV